jgi:FkbH-like protein
VEDYLSQLRTRVTLGQADRVALPSLVEIVERAEAVQLVGEQVTRDCARIWMGSGIHQGYWVRVEDRFGDQGLVGLVVVEIGEESWGIESFQLSGGLLERGVDAEVLRSVAELAVAQGAQRLELLGKGRNKAAFESLGFVSSAQPGIRCQLDLTGDWRSNAWRPSYVEDTVVLADEETEVAA